MPGSETRIMIRWLPEYATGVQEIDAEHQALFVLAEKLSRAIQSGHGQELVGPLLDELFEYTGYHFTHEEQLMERIAYPHYADHCRQHLDLRYAVSAMNDRYAAGETGMAAEVLEFVSGWLKCHTTTSDRRIGSYMLKHGLV